MTKKKILGICGSASLKSSNLELLRTLSDEFDSEFDWIITNSLRDFPMFRPEDLDGELDPLISEFKSQVEEADAIVIITPEYTHNLPAILKNALEWCTASGEFAEKPVLPITFTPAEPRGKYAMRSIIESLKTLDSRVVSQLELYKTDVEFEDYQISLNSSITELLRSGLELLV
tara:strand:+ start:32280 stop:32801 length:522 start_codon:yes stop_codon:yes gene_type:complete